MCLPRRTDSTTSDMCQNEEGHPKCVFAFSGKRKSGKDFLTDLLLERLGHNCAVIVKTSAPIKKHWAESRGLDLSKLMDSSSYKEQYREDMIKWGESVRERDYGYFCRSALELFQAYQKPVWIISDVRRKSDIKWFKEKFGDCVKTIRVTADDSVRQQRGWIFTKGVDDVASECDLDDVAEWDWIILNNGTPGDVERDLVNLVDYAIQCTAKQNLLKEDFHSNM